MGSAAAATRRRVVVRGVITRADHFANIYIRTSAERDEDFIYTHYEGWLPDDDERPTTLWANAWSPITRNTYPKASTSLTINGHGAAHDPTIDI